MTRFKQNVVQSANIEDFILGSHEGSSVSQWTAANVDHNIATIDGKQTVHGMGIVIATTGQFGVERVGLRYLIPHVIRNKGVRIVQYISFPRPGISGTMLRSLERLNVSYTSPVSTNLSGLLDIIAE